MLNSKIIKKNVNVNVYAEKLLRRLNKKKQELKTTQSKIKDVSEEQDENDAEVWNKENFLKNVEQDGDPVSET